MLARHIWELFMLPWSAMSSRLLVHADDDPDWAFLVERALLKSGLTKWNYKHLASGAALMHYLGQAQMRVEPRPDLLVLDIRMPGLDGLEVLEWATGNLPELPVVMLSSSELLSDRLAARDLGSKGYFSKAAIFSEFIEFLRGWEETAFATAATVSHGRDPQSNCAQPTIRSQV
jgi:CheY-like chemotaxis protein